MLIVGIDESKLDAEHWKRIESLARTIVRLPKDSPETKSHMSDADCLLVNFGVAVDKEDIDIARKLKYIGVLATAYGKIDTDHAKKAGIAVCNIPGYSTESVAEFVFAAVLDRIRSLERGKNEAREKNYSGTGFSASEIKNKTFGVIGLGRIGGRIAEIALGFGASVAYWSRNRKAQLEAKGVTYEDVDALIPKCDFLSINLAQTKETENFLDAERIRKIKIGAIVINTAPMELVDVGALEERLAKGDITVILDHSDEMVEDDLEKLSKHANCVIYPPIAYVSDEAITAKQEIFAGNIENFLKGSPANKI